MGKIRTKNIKRFVIDLLNNHSTALTTNFEENKDILKRILSDNISKSLRNRVNGYIVCRLRKSFNLEALE